MGFALNDTLMTIAVAVATSYIFNISLVYSLIAWFVGGEILHYVFGVQTEVLNKLGIRVNCKN
jgi:divalent metal cation (Fe/Co/Zn/Cd) transporter